MNVKNGLSSVQRKFRSHFGTTSIVCAIIWKKIYDDENTAQHLKGAKPEHLLWCLLFLKVYSGEAVHASLVGCDEKTFRKWAWTFVTAIADMHDDFVSVILIVVMFFTNFITLSSRFFVLFYTDKMGESESWRYRQ